MKTVIITVPMKQSDNVHPIIYPVDGNKAIEYDKPVRCPVNAVLAKTMKKDEDVRVIYIMTVTTGDNSQCEQNKDAFKKELEKINSEIGAVLSYDTIQIDFEATKKTYNKLITDLTEKIPEKSEIYADITYSFKTLILSLVCALRFVEEFRDAFIQYIVYGKVEFKKDGETEHPMLFDITSLYYLFKLIGSINNADVETASKMLNDFFAL
jgi:hypothetical protein